MSGVTRDELVKSIANTLRSTEPTVDRGRIFGQPIHDRGWYELAANAVLHDHAAAIIRQAAFAIEGDFFIVVKNSRTAAADEEDYPSTTAFADALVAAWERERA